MSDVGETVPLEDAFDVIDAEMGYLLGLLHARPQEGQGSWSIPADSAPEGAADFICALFAAGATPRRGAGVGRGSVLASE
eukprot:12832841-Alexandrium_andersonii.AAC.1